MASKPKRPRDPNQLAKLVVDISTGETEDKVSSVQATKKHLTKPKVAKALRAKSG